MKAYSYKILCFGPNRHDSDEASLRESMEWSEMYQLFKVCENHNQKHTCATP